jgi:hypothetical protein
LAALQAAADLAKRVAAVETSVSLKTLALAPSLQQQAAPLKRRCSSKVAQFRDARLRLSLVQRGATCDDRDGATGSAPCE